MPNRKPWIAVAALTLSCANEVATPTVEYGAAEPVGLWTESPEAGSRAADGGASTDSSSASRPAPGAVTSLTFDVTTSPVGYRYQPKNIGAIWIEDSSATLVKSLEVWAGKRRRWLTRYSNAVRGSAIDVITAATLASHRSHHTSWNMQDKAGNRMPAGSYTLVMELTDGDKPGRSHTLSFDTSLGRATFTPENAPSFGAMKLTLK